MSEQLTLNTTGEVKCTVLEVKHMEGHGYTIDAILVQGVLREGDRIFLCGFEGPIDTTIRAILTPQPLKDQRVKGAFLRHREVKAAMGIKIIAKDSLEHALAGGPLLVFKRGDDAEEMMDEVQADLHSLISCIDSKGVYVQASTLGSLEALLSFLKEKKIPVSGISIGDVHKKDVIKASIMLDSRPEYATILAFDVKVMEDARLEADRVGVRIFTEDIIYQLTARMEEYLEEIKEERRKAVMHEAIFPVALEILPDKVFRNKDPIIMGVRVVEGILKLGTPISAPNQMQAGSQVVVGECESIQDVQGNEIKEAKVGMEVCVKFKHISQRPVMYGRQFTADDVLYSKLSRRSINVLKELFAAEMKDDWWRLVIRLKGVFNIE
jgi:translation initiation factor 5B